VSHRFPAGPDPDALPEPAAARLLARASELDTALTSGAVRVADLRAAATEAGISAPAFDAALAELRDAGPAGLHGAPRQPRRRGRAWGLAAACAALIAAGALGLSLRPAAPGPVPGAPMVDEAYLLRCLSGAEAADLIRPHLTLPANTARVREGSRVLNVRATPAQLRQIRAVLERHESAGSPACASGPTGGAPR
jgi:hypothetical protein